MTSAFVTINDRGGATILRRAEGPRGNIGDVFLIVEPGENYEGWTFEALIAHGDGEITIPYTGD